MPELLVVLAIVVLLFGAKKIPELAKGVGKGIKDFKKAMNEDDDEQQVASKKELENRDESKVAAVENEEKESAKA
jgi:sec-independent protein translocase protein TatA